MILWQMTESISTGKLSSAKIPQAQRAQSMRGRQQPRRCLCAHSEPHKSSQARAAPLTPTQEMRRKRRRRRAGRLGVGGRKKGRKKKCISLSPFWSAAASTYMLWWRAHITLFLRQIWHVLRKEANRQRNGMQDRRGMWMMQDDPVTNLVLKHPWVEE